MAIFFNNPQLSVLSQVAEALQQLQNDPQQLDSGRYRRYDEPPPPYPESGETTQPSTPVPPVVDESYQRELRELARYKSTPFNQFKSQAKREQERLVRQISEERFGRQPTLPWDDSSDLQANSENNVRSRWVEQGIWGKEWGPAWPKDSHPMTKWEHQGGGPFCGQYNPTTSESRPGARWGHEKSEPELELEPKSEPTSAPEQERHPISGIFGLGVGQPERPKPRRRPIKYIQTPLGLLPQYPIPTPTVPNSEASRPSSQFTYHISKERDWIKDETNYKAPGSVINLDAMAYKGVKNNWIKDGIWNPKWGKLPGKTWIHEDSEEEKVVEAPAAPDDSGRRPSDTADGRQQAHGPQHPSLFGPAPSPAVTNGRTNGGPTQAPRDVEAGTTETQPSGRARESFSRQVAITGTQVLKRGPRGPLRRAKSSQAESSSAATVRSQEKIHPSAEGRLKRNRGDDDLDEQTSQSRRLNISEGLPASERSRSSEHEQPPKRRRYNTRHSGFFPRNADTADTKKESYNSKTVVTTRAMEVRALRRSSRIAERETKRMAGRPGRGDPDETSTPNRDKRRVAHIVRAKTKK